MDVLNRLFEEHFRSPAKRVQPLQGELGGSGARLSGFPTKRPGRLAFSMAFAKKM